jgi:outer membrane protein assembly factor BamB
MSKLFPRGGLESRKRFPSLFQPGITGITMSMRSLYCFVGTTILLASFSATIHGADRSWPQFRGPSGQGISLAEKLPISWSESEGVRWKTPVHGRGWSSPVVADGKVWLSTATEDGRLLSAICVSAESGEILHDKVLFKVSEPQFAHKFNSYASPTPVIAGKRVVVSFGSPGIACLDTETYSVLWERRDIECNHFRGAGSSPIVFGDLLILNFDGSDHQFVTALDLRSGKTVWHTQRSIDFQDLNEQGLPDRDGDWRKAFSTPHVAFIGETPLLLSIGSKALYGYEPLTGRELWRTESRVGHSASTRPTIAGDLIVYCTGFSKGELWCVRPGGRGDVTDTHVNWKLKRSVPNKPSLILHDGSIFMIHDGGVASCVDLATGQPVWQERVGGNYSASPILHEGRIYFFSEEGKATVIEAKREFQVLATNQLDDGFMASPAVVENALILRTKTNLYRVEAK